MCGTGSAHCKSMSQGRLEATSCWMVLHSLYMWDRRSWRPSLTLATSVETGPCASLSLCGVRFLCLVAIAGRPSFYCTRATVQVVLVGRNDFLLLWSESGPPSHHRPVC